MHTFRLTLLATMLALACPHSLAADNKEKSDKQTAKEQRLEQQLKQLPPKKRRQIRNAREKFDGLPPAEKRKLHRKFLQQRKKQNDKKK